MAKAYIAECGDKYVRQEAREENNNPQVFVPGSGVRYGPPRGKSIEGPFVPKIKAKKERK